MPVRPAAMLSSGSEVPTLALEAGTPWSSILVQCWAVGGPPKGGGFAELCPAEEYTFHLILQKPLFCMQDLLSQQEKPFMAKGR